MNDVSDRLDAHLAAARRSASAVIPRTHTSIDTRRMEGAVLIQFADAICVPRETPYLTIARIPPRHTADAAVWLDNCTNVFVLTLGFFSLRLAPLNNEFDTHYIRHRDAITNLDVAHRVAIAGTVAERGMGSKMLYSMPRPVVGL